MLSNLVYSFAEFMALAKLHLGTIFMILVLLWGINIINWLVLGKFLNIFGIVPRTIYGIPGIALSSFLHGNFNHLFFNSIPLFVLGLFMLTLGTTVFYESTVLIILIEGSALWLFGRHANHIGASGLIAGYFSYLLVHAYYNPSIVAVFLAGIVLYYFGGILLSLFPSEEKVSWEGHLFGFSAGIVAVYLQTFS